MARRIPSCAYCGDALEGQGYRITCDLPGSPAVAWHAEVSRYDGLPLRRCWDEDPLFRTLQEEQQQHPRDVVRLECLILAIEARGEDRVTARRAWHEYLRLSA